MYSYNYTTHLCGPSFSNSNCFCSFLLFVIVTFKNFFNLQQVSKNSATHLDRSPRWKDDNLLGPPSQCEEATLGVPEADGSCPRPAEPFLHCLPGD